MAKDTDIPVLSADLIAELDKAYPPKELPLTMAAWQAMDENRLRAYAFYAGQRALIDMLKGWLYETNNPEEGNDRDADRPTELDVYETEFGRVLSDSRERPEVAPSPVARATLGAVLDSDLDDEGDG